MYQSENFFINSIRKQENAFRYAGTAVLTMAEIPKYVFELLGVCTIFALFYISNQFDNESDLLALNGLYAVATIKIIPSMNRIVTAYRIKAASLRDDIVKIFSGVSRSTTTITNKAVSSKL